MNHARTGSHVIVSFPVEEWRDSSWVSECIRLARGIREGSGFMKESEIPERRFDPSTSFGLISLSRFAKLFDNDSRRLNKKPHARARESIEISGRKAREDRRM